MNVTKIAIPVFAATMVLASWGAQARPTRHVPRQTPPSVTEPVAMQMNEQRHPETDGMCEVSRMQVPATDGLEWKTIEDCDQD